MRTILIYASLATAIVATVASTPQAGDISGSGGPFDVTLTAASSSSEDTITGSVDAPSAINGSSGDVRLSANFTEGTNPAQVRVSLSGSGGDSSETDVLDTNAQSFVSVGVNAFADCGDGSCSETFTVTFDRLEADVTDDLQLSWSIDGSVSVADASADGGSGGTLTFE